MSSLGVLDLFPPEVRHKIYKAYFENCLAGPGPGLGRLQGQNADALLFTSKSIQAEAEQFELCDVTIEWECEDVHGDPEIGNATPITNQEVLGIPVRFRQAAKVVKIATDNFSQLDTNMFPAAKMIEIDLWMGLHASGSKEKDMMAGKSDEGIIEAMKEERGLNDLSAPIHQRRPGLAVMVTAYAWVDRDDEEDQDENGDQGDKGDDENGENGDEVETHEGNGPFMVLSIQQMCSQLLTST